MSFPTNLFIDSPDVEDPSMTALSTDSSKWPEEIITKLKERIPAVGTSSLSVKLMHTDDELGTATGSVTITNGQKTAVVPTIVKDFSLYPLDVFIFEGKILPLNPDYFAQAFQDGGEGTFQELTEYPLLTNYSRYMNGESLHNTIFPPNYGRYSYASDRGLSAEKVASLGFMSDAIAPHIDGSVLLKKAQQDNTALGYFYRHKEAYEQFRKLANLRPVNLGEFSQSAQNLIERPIHVLSKDGPNKYTILSTAKNHFNPAMSTYDRLGVRGFVSKISDKVDSIMHDLDQNGEKILHVSDDTAGSVFLAKPSTDKVEEATSFGRYNVRTKTGVNVEGVVVTTVIDYGQNPLPVKLFLGKTVSTLQERICGMHLPQSDFMPEGSEPLAGQTGTFFYSDGKGALATLPVTIKSIMKVDDCSCSYHVNAVDVYGRPVRLQLGDMGNISLERILPTVDGSTVRYRIPGKMKWVAMEGFDEVSNSPEDYAMKVAAETLTIDPAVLLDRKSGIYALRGLDKYASVLGWNQEELTPTQAKFLLAAVGTREDVINEAFKYASLKGKAELHGINRLETWNEKVAAQMPKARNLTEQAAALRTDLFKVASYIENAQTVDSLLSLNFVNAENISKFVAKIPLFKSAISNLAAALLASRIGLREIPEQSASTAIHKLQDVVRGLESLRAAMTLTKK